jgi:hypothetical protein
MRRRWRLRWRLGFEDVALLGFGWCFVFGLTALGLSNHIRIAWWLDVVMGLFGLLPLVVAMLVGLFTGLRWFWRNPPFERVTESVEDMRKAYRDDG